MSLYNKNILLFIYFSIEYFKQEDILLYNQQVTARYINLSFPCVDNRWYNVVHGFLYAP